mmetsp:Transcript_3396/g.5763  ORF Transcript_3396/g.5763 Transcript_3396/m.5763 type:complete len:248 (-) Transcript_3396:561-1304(-)
MLAVHECKSDQHLLAHISDVLLWPLGNLVANQVVQVATFNVLHGNPNRILIRYCLSILHNVGMLTHSMHSDLLFDVSEFFHRRNLDCLDLPVAQICDFIHDTSSAFAQLLLLAENLVRVRSSDHPFFHHLALEHLFGRELWLRAFKVKTEHVENLLRVILYILFGDTGGLQDSFPFFGEAFKAQITRCVYLYVVVHLKVKWFANTKLVLRFLRFEELLDARRHPELHRLFSKVRAHIAPPPAVPACF